MPFDHRAMRAGGPANSLFLQPNAGTAGLLQALEVCGVFLATAVRDAPPDRRATTASACPTRKLTNRVQVALLVHDAE